MIKQLAYWIIENWGEILTLGASAFIVIKYGIKLFKWCKSIIDPIKAWVKKMDDAAKQLEFNGGSSVKDIVQDTNNAVLALTEVIHLYKGKQDVLTRNIITPLYECDGNGILVSVNRSWEALTGMDIEDAIGAGWKRIIYGSDFKRVEKEGLDFIKVGRHFNGDFRIVNQITKDVIEVHCSSSKIFDSKGICISIVGTLIKK